MTPDDQDPQAGSPDAASAADPIEAPGSTPNWDADDNPWKTRFETYRSEADRRNTQLSQYEQAIEDFQSGDPEQMRRAAHILNLADHLEIPDPEPEFDPDDPMAALQAQVEELSGKLTAQEQRDQEARVERVVEDRLSKLEGLDESDRDLVLAQAIRMPADAEGLPDITGAYEALRARDQARIDAEMRKWADGKKQTPIAPGTTGSQQEDIMSMDKDQLRARDRAAIERAAIAMQES
jgi:hypothetical protein